MDEVIQCQSMEDRSMGEMSVSVSWNKTRISQQTSVVLISTVNKASKNGRN